MLKSCEKFLNEDGDLLDCECGTCGNIWWMPLYGDDIELSSPRFCPACGIMIDFTLDEEVDDYGY